MAIVKKKIWPKYFELISSGKKRFELRLADFDVQEGDTLILEEWNPENKEYTGRTIEKKIGYILKFDLDSFGQEQEIKDKGIFIIQFEE
jgi:ASC-1-like (ASCH) protein